MIAQFTPEQAAKLLDAINQQNWIIVVAGMLWLGGAMLQLWVGKRIEAAVANRQHFGRLRYERELELYRVMWAKLQTHVEQVVSKWTWQETDSDADLKRSALQRAEREFFDAIAANKPFFPKEIWTELDKFRALCVELLQHQEAMQTLGSNADYSSKQRSDEIRSSIFEQHKRVEEAIRRRLDKFDGA